jgi:FemAB-related protein (PEP-CTERM system-associated)
MMRTLTKDIDTRPERHAGAVEVRGFAAADAASWDAFVHAHPRATLFHLTAWKRVLEETFGYPAHYLVALRGGRTAGVLPLFLCRSIRGERGLFSLPHTVYGGPLGEDAEVEEALVDGARAAARRLGANAIELRNRHATLVDAPPLEGFVTFEKELPGTVDAVRGTFPKKAREMLNQATKRHKLAADFAGDLDAFYPLLAASFHRLGTPVFPRRFFRAMMREFGDQASVLLIRHGDEPVSAVLSIVFRDTMSPLYSGEGVAVRDLKSNNFKYFKLMEYAVERGLRRFDFGRSRANNEGVVRFKENQGFSAESLPYQILHLDGAPAAAADPNSGFFQKARRIWSRLPAPVARTFGPAIVKYFP